MTTNSKNYIPLYKQIANYIREKVDNQEWPVGFQIPSETELCEKFSVSRITVVKALERLVEEGILRREQGKGTFVSMPKLSYETSELRSFTEEAISRGKKPSSLVLSKSWSKPTKKIQQDLQLNDDDKVWSFRRLMFSDDVPLGIQTSYLPMKDFPELITSVVDNASLYQILQKQYGVLIDKAYETYRAVQLDEEEKELLQVELGETGFSVDRLSFSNDKPVEYVQSIMRADLTQYTVKLMR